MNALARLTFLVTILGFGWSLPVSAQPNLPASAQPKRSPTQVAQPAAPQPQQGEPTPANTPAPPGWVARCTSVSRETPPECAMEETAVLAKTGQLVILVNVRVPSDTRTPIILVQLPLGLNLPAGIRVQVDEGKTADMQIQTCESRGCYASMPVPADLLAALKSGKQLKVSFQNLGKETVTVPMPLADFPAAYEKIK
jgi:invasion protein IalB